MDEMGNDIRLKHVPKRDSGFDENIFDLMSDLGDGETPERAPVKKTRLEMMAELESGQNDPRKKAAPLRKLINLNETELDKDYIFALLNKPIKIKKETAPDGEDGVQIREPTPREADATAAPRKTRRRLIRALFAVLGVAVITYAVTFLYVKSVNDGIFRDVSGVLPIADHNVKYSVFKTRFALLPDGGADMSAYYADPKGVLPPVETGTSGLTLIGDSSFTLNDRVSLDGVPFDDDLFSPDLGAALFAALYHSGELPLSRQAYATVGGKTVQGYDLTAIPFFKDGGRRLSELAIPCADDYKAYYNRTSKWDFKSIENGFLPFNDVTGGIVDVTALRRITTEYDFVPPTESGGLAFARDITFQVPPGFASFENSVVDVGAVSPWERELINALLYYDSIAESASPLAAFLSFGSDGSAALDALAAGIENDETSVILADGRVYCVVKVSVGSDRIYALEIHDNKNARRVLTLKGYDTDAGAEQFTASLDGEEIPVFLVLPFSDDRVIAVEPQDDESQEQEEDVPQDVSEE